MKTKFSNKYIFIYSAVLVIVAAVILAVAAVGLKPFQEKNIRVEKKQQLLSSVNISSNAKNAEELYNKYFTKEYAINIKGDIVSSYVNGKLNGKIRPFDIVIKDQFEKIKKGDMSACLPVYECEKDGQKYYVIPMIGNGLWGGIWGNVALKDDMKTIVGVNFDHKSETPGLGAEITTSKFQNQFKGKTIFEENNFTSVTVEKRADMNNPHKVDALSGATLTSKGVSNMIDKCLRFYIPYFNSMKK